MRLSHWIAPIVVVILLGPGAPSTHAQTPTSRTVRIAGPNAWVVSRPAEGAEPLAVVPIGTELEVLQRDGDWYWVLLARDALGTQRAGWLRGQDVEGHVGEEAVAEQQKAKLEEKKPKPPDTRRLKAAEEELEKARANYDEVVQRAAEAQADSNP